MLPGEIVWAEDRNGGHYGFFMERLGSSVLVAFGTSTRERFDTEAQRLTETLLVLEDPRILRNFPPLRTTTYFYRRWLSQVPLDRLQRSQEWGKCTGLKFQQLAAKVHEAMMVLPFRPRPTDVKPAPPDPPAGSGRRRRPRRETRT